MANHLRPSTFVESSISITQTSASNSEETGSPSGPREALLEDREGGGQGMDARRRGQNRAPGNSLHDPTQAHRTG
ncbi:MAG: hypothetical protein ACRD21_05495 [Vicinamibacteria bacterium]